jgi:hypothetical protein
MFDFRGAFPERGASTVTRLGEAPVEARDALLARLDEAAFLESPAHAANHVSPGRPAHIVS